MFSLARVAASNGCVLNGFSKKKSKSEKLARRSLQ